MHFVVYEIIGSRIVKTNAVLVLALHYFDRECAV